MQLTLSARPESVGRGRRWVVGAARREHAPQDVLDVLELLTSELVANAVEHGGGHGVITVRTCHHEDHYGVAVSDRAPGAPVVRAMDPYDTGGRGIGLVDLLAAEWGVRTEREGKAVWFRVAAAGDRTPVAA